MASVSTSIRYREALHTAIMAKAKAVYPDKTEAELKAVPVTFAKPPQFTQKWTDAQFCPHRTKVSILSIVAGADGIPQLNVKCEEGERVITGKMLFTNIPDTAEKRLATLLGA